MYLASRAIGSLRRYQWVGMFVVNGHEYTLGYLYANWDAKIHKKYLEVLRSTEKVLRST